MTDLDHEAWQENHVIQMAHLQAQINALTKRIEQLEANQYARPMSKDNVEGLKDAGTI